MDRSTMKVASGCGVIQEESKSKNSPAKKEDELISLKSGNYQEGAAELNLSFYTEQPLAKDSQLGDKALRKVALQSQKDMPSRPASGASINSKQKKPEGGKRHMTN